ncbi:MAG: hypothetical protein DYG89_02255 [Caldilinea sp. CFX5]|nr:hypothetical protein [Caldilinea sp. CFX5]
MENQELEQRIREEIIAKQFPEMLGIAPQIEVGPSESKLRALRRLRGTVSTEEEKSIPQEFTVTYHRPADAQQPFARTIVVVTDDSYQTRYIIESK